MPRKKTPAPPADEEPAPTPVPRPAPPTAEPKRRRSRRETLRTVAHVAHAIRHRDELLESAIALMHGAGLIDGATRDRVWNVYQRGDARTRLFIQELVARVLKVPFERLDELVESGRIEDVSEETLARLEDLQVPRLDIDAVAERVRSFDVDRFIAKGGQNRFVRFLGDLPVQAHRLRLALVGSGVVLVVIAAAALAFPGYALWIALYGFIGFLAIVGALLVRWGVLLGRAAKAYDIDLAVYARLAPEERQILLLRRVYVGLVDMDRVGDWVERGLNAVVPQTMQGAPPPKPSAPRKRAAASAGDDVPAPDKPKRGRRKARSGED